MQQLQIDRQKQIQDQAYSYSIIGNIFSAFECYANKFQTDASKKTQIFSAYNNFDCGNQKNQHQLKIQIIAQLEILNASYQLYIHQYKQYDFPKKLSRDEMEKLLKRWEEVVPEEDKKFYVEASNIISGKGHVSYINELGTCSSVNPQFLANATELMYQANKVGENAVENYKKTGKTPDIELYSSQIGNANINKTNKRETERRKEIQELDSLLNEIHVGLTNLMDKPPTKNINERPHADLIIGKFLEKLFSFTNKWQLYWYTDNKDLHRQKVKEIISLCNKLIQKGNQKFRFERLMNELSDGVK